VIAHPIIGILALWCAARALGSLATALRQPAVIGELLAGALFSPSFLGGHFRVQSPLMATAALYSGIAFLFFAGFDIKLSSVMGRMKSGVATAVAGAAVPFALGYLFGTRYPTHFGFDGHSTLQTFGLFFGVSLAVSALPVIARTLMDVGLYRSPIGMVTMSAVIIDDVIGWVAFSTLVATNLHDRPGAWKFHAPVAAYLIGLALREILRERDLPAQEKLEWFANRVLSPLFFSVIGLKLGNVAQFDLGLTLSLIAIASVGKIFACAFVSRKTGMSSRDAWAVGFAMNSRGAMSVLLSSLSHELGIIGDRLFLALVIMALVTSMISGPALRRITKPSGMGWA